MFSKTKLVTLAMFLVMAVLPITLAVGSSDQDVNDRENEKVGEVIDVSGPSAFYRSKGNESILDVSLDYDLDPWLIAELNHMKPKSKLVKGQKILLPDDKVIVHEVTENETIYGIARIYNSNIQRIIDENDVRDVYKLQIGVKLLVPVSINYLRQNLSRGSSNDNTLFEWPTKGYFSSSYGFRWGRMHEGIDIANEVGTPIKAARSGIVSFAGSKGSYGNAVIINHGNQFSTRYGHISEILVKEGQYVYQGDSIALMGNTGRSTGPHLHFEIRVGDNPVNPKNYLPKQD